MNDFERGVMTSSSDRDSSRLASSNHHQNSMNSDGGPNHVGEDNLDYDPEFEKQTEEDLRIRLTPPALEPGEHQLECFYTLWFSKRLTPHRMRHVNYDDLVKAVISFQSVEQFWRVNLHTLPPSQLPHSSSYHVFKNGIRPLWEDSANRSGGKWYVRVRRNFVDRCWENLLLALLGEQFVVGDEITGVVLANRPHQSVISVWTRTCNNEALKQRISQTMRRVMQIPPSIQIEYRAHEDSLGNQDGPNPPVNGGGGGGGNGGNPNREFGSDFAVRGANFSTS